MSKTIYEEKNIPVSYNCDVLIAGGGFAGISAALASARHGKKVILLEKQYVLGGLATSGLVTIYLPLCDGYGKQVSFGIAEELLRLSISMGAEDRYPENWLDYSDPSLRNENTNRFSVQFNPWLFAILVEKELLKYDVTILYGSYAVGVRKEGNRISHVIIEGKSGREAIETRSVIDTTGDSDIAYFAGAPTAEYSYGNVLPGWYYSLSNEGYKLHMVGYAEDPGRPAPEGSQGTRYRGLSTDEISAMTQASHKITIEDIIKRREKNPELVPTSMTTIPQLRMTRRLVGEYEEDITEEHTYFEDSIGMIANWRKRGPVYEVPYRTLYSKVVPNLLTAGRTVSVTDKMWDIMRVIPCCAVTGEACGTAAALSDDFPTLRVSLLQETLRKQGVRIHENELS